MKPHVFHPAAEEEYTAATLRYFEIEPELGRRFFDEMERLIQEARRQPLRYWQFDPPARRHRSTLFPYAVVYLDQPDRIWIVAVMHGNRLPGYWKDRTD